MTSRSGVVSSGVAIGGSAGSRNRGPRPLGAPDRGNNLFYLQEAKSQDLEETEICLLAFSKMERAYCIQFSKTLTDSSDEELCNKLWLRSLATSRSIQMRSLMSR